MGKVRCLKISTQSYENILLKNEDILYFVNDTGSFGPLSMEKNGTIYLGDKILARGANGTGYGTCTTNLSASGSTMVVSLPGYNAVNDFVSVKFSYAVPVAAYMNVNSKGAYRIRLSGSNLPAGVIGSSDIATFYFDGTYYNLVSVYNKDSIDNTLINFSYSLYDIFFVSDRESVITEGNDTYLLFVGAGSTLSYDNLKNGTLITIDFSNLQDGVSELILAGLTNFYIKFEDTTGQMTYIDDGDGGAMLMSKLIGARAVTAVYNSSDGNFYVSSIVYNTTDTATSGSKALITSGGVYNILGDIESLLAAI